MDKPISDLAILLVAMKPFLNEGRFVFATLPHNIPSLQPIATIHEKEGLCVIVSEEEAKSHGLTFSSTMAWITLEVHSDLEAVGLTAAFSTALGKANISCNVLAGAYHDHIFVPYDKKEEAIEVLLELQRN